jgi:dihydrofolate reductase
MPGQVGFDITMSLDGFIAGPNDSLDQPLGEGGERLHEWVFGLASWREPHGLEGGETNRDSEVLEEAMSSTGAIVLGRRMFDLAKGWGDNPPFHMPVFVLTHEARDPLVKEGGTTFTFVNGIESALEQARAAAGGKRRRDRRRREHDPAVPERGADRRVPDSHRSFAARRRYPVARTGSRRPRAGADEGDRVPPRDAPQVPRREVRWPPMC